LSAIARNLWLFELRTRDRRKKREKFYADSSDKIIVENEHFLDRSDRQSLEQIFDQIGATCKRILTGFYFENRSMKELIGEFDFENEQVLRNKKSKCMKKVKEMLLNNTALMENLKPLSLYEQ
jgi:RNA polymerase sigma-70 factor (ECF subfamily)